MAVVVFAMALAVMASQSDERVDRMMRASQEDVEPAPKALA